jgi:site-specific recombinase XerD
VRIEVALAKYTRQLQADGRSQHTIDQYDRHVRLLSRWWRARRRRDRVEDLTHEDLAEFLVSDAARLRPDGQPKKATATNALRSSLRSFFAYLHAAGNCERNAAQLIRRARCASPPPRALSAQDCRRLLGTLAKDDSPAGRRDHALFGVMLGTGLRLGAALSLRVEDLDWETPRAYVRRDKGDRPAMVTLPPAAQRALRAHLDGRTEGHVFLGAGGRPLCARQARRRLRLVAIAAEIKRNVFPHALRHTYASELLKRAGNLAVVQRALHHRSIASTAVYAQSSG